jgi:hypothetical protein
MSRTYRRHVDHYVHAWGNKYHWKEWHEMNPFPLWGYQWVLKVNRKSRDKKRWDKPPKWFKKMHRRMERARVNSRMKNEDYDNIPEFKNTDRWNWT